MWRLVRPIFLYIYREIYKTDSVISPNLRLIEVYQENDELIALLRNEYTLQEEERGR